MADVKWVKLTTDMFDNRKIKHLRRLPEGNSIVLIWVMLLTMAGRCNSGGMIFLTENIPYTTKMLADELDFEENTVKLALDALARLNMIVADSGFFAIAGWEEYQNIEGMEKIREQNRIRQANYKAKHKLLQSNVTDNVTLTLGNATEEEIEEEKEEEDKKNSVSHQPSKADVDGFFESIWELYPVKKGKGQVSASKRKALYEIGFEKMQQAIDRYLEELKKDASWRKPQNGSTFFNSGYVDYLDDNFVPDQVNRAAKNKVPGWSGYEMGDAELSAIRKLMAE